MTGKNLTWHKSKVSADDRSRLIGHRGLVVWFTGLSGSGKSTIAVEVEKILLGMGLLAFRLDGDNVRHGLNSDLGFSRSDRQENIRRVGEVAALFRDAGLISLVAFITPYRKMRKMVRTMIGPDDLIEVYVKAEIAACIGRDPKLLYKKAKKGQVKEFTGISAPYEEPKNPDLVLDTDKNTIRGSADLVINAVLKHLKRGNIRAGAGK